MNWISITDKSQLAVIKAISNETPCVIYKHSSTCYTSDMMKYTLEQDWQLGEAEVKTYFLDILNHRNIAAEIADMFQVHHESPQLLLIKNGECTYDADRLDIKYEELVECLEDDAWS